MNEHLKKSILSIFLILSLSACDGDVLFRTRPCEEGTVRNGTVCLPEHEVSAKSGICENPDLGNVKKGVTVVMCDGSQAEGTYDPLSTLRTCSADGEQECIVKSKFKAVDSSKLDSSKIANGTTIVGVSGSMRSIKQCRNYSDVSTFDSSYPPSNLGWASYTFAPAAVTIASDQIDLGTTHGLVTNSPVRFTTSFGLPSPLVVGTIYYAIYVSTTAIRVASVQNGAQIDITSQGTGTHTAHDAVDGTAQYFDTIDDRNNVAAFSPPNNPWSTSEYLCDSSNFINVTSGSAPFLPSGLTPSTGNQPFTQIWQDQLSGLYVSNVLYDGVPGNRNWSDAIRTSESLNGGTAGSGWRLPGQKEFLQLYIDGISKVNLSGASLSNYFWTSTINSALTTNAWRIDPSSGYSDRNTNSPRITTSNLVLCVR